MKLWRFRDGIPSVADGVLIVMAPLVFSCGVFFDPILDYFEPRGLVYLGYGFNFVVLMGCAAGVGAMIRRNHRKTRDELRVPRAAFAVVSFLVSLLTMFGGHELMIWLLLRRGAVDDGLWWKLMALQVVICTTVYPFVIQFALRRPLRANRIAGCMMIVLGLLGMVGKILGFILRLRR